MQQHTITLLQDSWQKVAAIAPQAAELFYQNLFAADTSLKPLFKGEMPGQNLGADFTEEVKEAWTAVYTVMADVMVAAAKP
jgi:hemoglobin-like flavoprotein